MEENGGNIVMECQSINNNRDKGDLSRNTGKCFAKRNKGSRYRRSSSFGERESIERR